tara:strand:+ start:314 stop:517 length:204 start_codon:yes stop_codon:yes gene_type:complete
MWEELPPLRLEQEMDAISLAPSSSHSRHFRDFAALPVALPNTSRYHVLPTFVSFSFLAKTLNRTIVK